jgi:hypothetical protein
VFGCAFVFSMNGETTTGPRAGSIEWPLLFETTTVALTTSGQSFIVPRGVGARAGSVARCVELRAICFLDFLAAQQLCERLAWQLSPADAVCTEVSAAMALVVQPNRQPPAIQTETLTARSNRMGFIVTAVYSRSSLFVEKLAIKRHKKHKVFGENSGHGYRQKQS